MRAGCGDAGCDEPLTRTQDAAPTACLLPAPGPIPPSPDPQGHGYCTLRWVRPLLSLLSWEFRPRLSQLVSHLWLLFFSSWTVLL